MKPELRYSFRLGKISFVNSLRTFLQTLVCFNIYNKFNANCKTFYEYLVSGIEN
jgi:hypothetical protein